MAQEPVTAAAERLRKEFKKADDENYGGGWYNYISRRDIERLVDYVLDPAYIGAEPEPEPPIYKLIVHDGDGNEVFSRDVTADDFASITDDIPEEQCYTTGAGQVIRGVHDSALCEGRGCVIHHPSDHHMKEWPTNWRHGGIFDIKPPHMERTCPHGVGHPDPDDVAFLGNDAIGVHGCDGCCRPPVNRLRGPDDSRVAPPRPEAQRGH